jgi:hypothetical protein
VPYAPDDNIGVAFDLTFPEDYNEPPRAAQLAHLLTVASTVTFELCFPEASVRGW